MSEFAASWLGSGPVLVPSWLLVWTDSQILFPPNFSLIWILLNKGLVDCVWKWREGGWVKGGLGFSYFIDWLIYCLILFLIVKRLNLHKYKKPFFFINKVWLIVICVYLKLKVSSLEQGYRWRVFSNKLGLGHGVNLLLFTVIIFFYLLK